MKTTKHNITNTAEPIKPGYKKTSVGIIPEDWEVKKLGEIGTVINGLTYSPDNIRDKGTLVLRSSNVQNRALSFEDNVYVDTSDLKFNPVKKNDILICVRNGSKSLIGKNALIISQVEGEAFGAFMSIYRSEINEYIFQFFGTDEYQRQINQNLGATINSINNNELRQFKLPIPPLPEQKAIADCLSTWDKGIEKLSALIASKKEQKKGLMQQLLTGKKRLDGFKEEWEEMELKDIGFVPNKQAVTEIGDKRTLTVRLYTKGIDFNDNAKTKITSSGRNYYIREVNEILIGRQNIHNGGIGLVKNEHDGHICSNAITSYIVNESNNLFFILYLLSFPCIYRPIERYMSGTGQKELSEKEFLNLSFKLPKLDEQNAIAKVLFASEKEVELLETKLESLKTQKKGLMQVLLTGQKRLV